MCNQRVLNLDLTLNKPSNNNMFNIELNYDINQALDPESWDSDFHVISLHRSIEHLVSDIKNIKDSLYRIGKYIKDKSIIKNNSNDIKYLDSISKVAWEFLSAFYEAHWDSLHVDKFNTSFRSKVK